MITYAIIKFKYDSDELEEFLAECYFDYEDGEIIGGSIHPVISIKGDIEHAEWSCSKGYIWDEIEDKENFREVSLLNEKEKQKIISLLFKRYK